MVEKFRKFLSNVEVCCCFVGNRLWYLDIHSCLCLVMADCEAGKIEVTLVRTYGSYASEESYTIYEGEGTYGTIVVPKVTGPVSGTTTTTTHCMYVGIHTVKMEDSYGDAWSSGSNLNVYIGGELIAVIHMTGNYPTYSDISTFVVAHPATSTSAPTTPAPIV